MKPLVLISGRWHRVERSERRFRRPGYVVIRVDEEGSTIGRPYWVHAHQIEETQ